MEFEITPNRPDCLSVIGLAREVAATYDAPLTLHEPVVKGGGPGVLTELLDVETPAADLVPRYTARMVRNVRNHPLPKWMRERLPLGWACAPSTTSWISPTTSCWSTASPCTPSTTAM